MCECMMDHGQLQQASANLTCADTPKQLQHVPQVRLNSQMAIAVVIITASIDALSKGYQCYLARLAARTRLDWTGSCTCS